MVKGKISLNKLEQILFMHSELKEKCILNIVFLTSPGQNYGHTSLKLKGSEISLLLKYLNLKGIAKFNNICSRQSSASKLCILAFNEERKGHTPLNSQQCHGMCIMALLLFSFCHSHAGKHRQNLANASCYHSQASVAPLQIFS